MRTFDSLRNWPVVFCMAVLAASFGATPATAGQPPLSEMSSMAFVCESQAYWKDKGDRLVKIDTSQGTLSITDQEGNQEIEPITDYMITYAEDIDQFGHLRSKRIISSVHTKHHHMRASPGMHTSDPYVISYERGSQFSGRAALLDDCNQM